MDDQFRSAVIDGDYRYRLDRRLRLSGERTVVFAMLNPSTADGRRDDPTLRRCMGYANDWDFDRLVVVNLFALRATDPSALLTAGDPVGPLNDRYLAEAVDEAMPNDDAVIVAWGAHQMADARARAVAHILCRRGPVMCLGATRDGHPKHPLYVRRDVMPAVWGFAA